MIITLSNILSLARGFLAFLFIFDSVLIRTLTIVAAMITDSLDGYLARRWKTTSSFGATLDPLMDKFFVIFIMGIFIREGSLEIWQALALISRDFAVLVFGFYLTLKGSWNQFQFQSIWAGKVSTTFQFFVLLALTFHEAIPTYTFYFFILLGLLALFELYLIEQRVRKQT